MTGLIFIFEMLVLLLIAVIISLAAGSGSAGWFVFGCVSALLACLIIGACESK